VLKRMVAAVAALAVVLPVLFFGGQFGAELLVAAVMFIVLYEYAPIADGAHRHTAFAVLALTGGALYSLVIWGPQGWLLMGVVGTMFAVLTWAMFHEDTPEGGARVGSMMAFGLVYLALPLSVIPKLRAFDDGLYWMFLVLVCTWASDTGAYFAGRAFGKRKLLERISPKKTWAGVWGGIVLSIVVGAGFAALEIPAMPLAHGAALGALIAATGVVGDLIESMFKRASGIKDTGGILPGHGGLLDRIDSLLFTVPAAWAYVRLFGLA
jgi:phosphatidate cytidylyltransferase